MENDILYNNSDNEKGYDNPSLSHDLPKTERIYVKPIIHNDSNSNSIWLEKTTSSAPPPNCSRDSIETIEVVELPSSVTRSTNFTFVTNESHEAAFEEKTSKSKKSDQDDKSESRKIPRDRFRKQSSVNVFDEPETFVELMSRDNVFIDPIKNKIQFIFTPPPPGVVVKCQINKTNTKDKTLWFTNFIFSLEISGRRHSIDKHDHDLMGLMAARCRKKTKTTNYVISSNPDNITSRNRDTIGKLRSNFLGNRFRMYRKGKNLSDSDDKNQLKKSISENEENDGENEGNEEADEVDDDESMHLEKYYDLYGVLFFKSTTLNAFKPRNVCVAIPKWNETKNKFEVTKSLPKDKKELTSTDKPTDYLSFFNLPPIYSKEKKCYTLDFGGRVKDTSVKNFALMSNIDDIEKRVFQFGKTDKHFIVDFTYPLCAFQAFCIGLSTLHHKLITD